MTTGKKEFAVQDRLDSHEKDLDLILEKIGLSYVKDEDSIGVLKISSSDLKMMESEECCIKSYQLQQYGMYVQSMYNRLENIKSWCDKNLQIIAVKNSRSYQNHNFMKMEEKIALAIKDSPHALKLNKILERAKGQCSEISNINQKIQKMSDTLLELSRIKRSK